MRDEIGIARDILVDDLEGTVHRAYGLLPNMTWVLGRGGLILYKAMWTTADRVAEFCESLDFDAVKRPGYGYSYSEHAEVRKGADEEFMRLLERNGPRAVTEFRRAMEIWTVRAREARRR